MFTQLSKELYAASFGQGTNSRILVFKTNGDYWEKVEGGNVLLVGKKTKKELRHLLNTQSRGQLTKAIPGGISGRTLTNLRAFLGISKPHGRPPLTVAPPTP